MKSLLAFFLLIITQISLGAVDYIPTKAFQYKNIIKSELDTYFPKLYNYNYIPSLIEHESCISLKSSKCWDATSELNTSRERGVGLGQITKTFKKNGSIRFDKLTEMRDQYKLDLKEASWSNINKRPDIQIRMLVLMIRDNYGKLYNIPDVVNRTQMTDASYNAGLGAVYKKRRACGLSRNCDPVIWFNNVESQCAGLNKPIYGLRSACDIVKNHVSDVFNYNLPKYNKGYFLKEN